MDKKIANMWIKALESGDYKQGKCALRNDNDCFCCLGVLCDLYDKDRKQKKKKSIKITNPKYNGNMNNFGLTNQQPGSIKGIPYARLYYKPEEKILGNYIHIFKN